ncbi:hypothetical protein [Candidatus Electronema sp. PJ]|uniref:hypothetical protein n=1 Tax=Candidatus Electronema sp. PJ TaxID=3401572 RepID=UPI003AA904CF
MKAAAKKFDNNQKVFVDDPIYTEYDLSGVDDATFFRLTKSGTIDAYCSECESKSVFRIVGPPAYQLADEAKKTKKYGLVVVQGQCTRQRKLYPAMLCNHNFYALFDRKEDNLVKIGQYPSKADTDFGELDESYKRLSPELRKELGTAIGLFAHGVGIGSFVYLRRIFEKLVDEARAQAEGESAIDIKEFDRARMHEKIIILKNYLPARLVGSANLYSILSKGIHELSEEECRENFILVRQAIQFILRQKHEEDEYKIVLNTINKAHSR